MKVRATIDIDEAKDMIGKLTSLDNGAYGCDKDGAYYMWYGGRNDLVVFEDVEVLE